MSDLPNSKPKYQEITRQLRGDLAAGRYGEEGRMPSEAQLVQRFGVSRPTAARALRELQQEGLIERRPGSGTFARPSREEKATSRVLAVLMADLGNTEIFQLICGEIASLARVHDYSLVWGGSQPHALNSKMNMEQAEELCRQFIKRNVSGVFFAPFELLPEMETMNRRIANMLREAGIPIVLLDRDLTPFPTRSEFDLVSVDNVAGGYLAAQHLLKLGCRRLHFVARPLSAGSIDGRIAGIREALSRWKLEPESGWLHIGEMSDKRFVQELLYHPMPDAFLCANDHTAAMLLRCLHEKGVNVPGDVRVVGYDDVKFATLVSPPLTTVQQPCRQIASTAFRAMLDRLAEPALPPAQMTLLPRLVVRDSCGAYDPRPRQGEAVR